MNLKHLAALSVVLGTLALAPAAVAGPVLQVNPHHVNFGKQQFNTFAKRTITVTNVSSEAVSVSVSSPFTPDDFSPGQIDSTCPLTEATLLDPGASCTHVVGYYADPNPPFLGHRRIELIFTATNASAQVVDTAVVRVSARGV
jgi:hypothetical protein